jgi:thiol-disulfide isomerase/thioredoxin
MINKMTFTTWGWLGLLLSLSACDAQAQPQPPGHHIDVTVDGFTQPEAYLAYYYGDKQYLKDTATVVDGVFTFQDTERLDGGIYLVVLPPENQYFEIIVDQDQHFKLHTSTEDYVKNMKIEGSQENKIFYDDIHFLAEMREKAQAIQAEIKAADKGSDQEKALQADLQAINKQVLSQRAGLGEEYPDMLYPKVIAAMEEPEIPPAPTDDNGKALDSLWNYHYYRAHFFDNLDFGDERLLRTPVMNQKITQYLEKLTMRHPDSIAEAVDRIAALARADSNVFQYVVINLLNKYAKSKIMGFDGIYVHIVEKYYLTGDAWWADAETIKKMEERALAISPTLVGRKAPNFRVQDVNGDYTMPQGVDAEYTVLYFWDYDCGHCKKTTPVLAKAIKLYDGKSVKLFTVNINGDRDVWKKKLGDYGLADLPNAINTHDARRSSGFDGMYDVRSTPRIFLLDADKKIMAKQISVAQLQEIIDARLGIDRPESEKIKDKSAGAAPDEEDVTEDPETGK